MAKLFVSSALCLSMVDTETEEIVNLNKILGLNDVYTYGLTWNWNTLFVGCQYRQPKTGFFIRRYDRELNRLPDINLGRDVFRDVHQIQWMHGKLWVVSSAFNNVIIIDYPFYRGTVGADNVGKYTVWSPNPDKPDTQYKKSHHKEDWNHFNSIWFEDLKVYLVAHNFDRGSEIWQFSYPELELENKWKSKWKSHNVARINGEIYNLGPDEEGAMEFEKDGKVKYGFGRGLAVSMSGFDVCKPHTDKIYIGASQYIPDREKRKEAKTGNVYVYNNKFECEKMIKMPCGEVREIRLIEKFDKAHHGWPWMGKIK